MFPTYPESRGPHGPGHRRLQRHRPRHRPGAVAPGHARFRATSDASVAAGDIPGAGRPRNRAGLRRGRARSPGKAGEYRPPGALGGHLQRRTDREHLCRRARGDVPRQRLLRVLLVRELLRSACATSCSFGSTAGQRGEPGHSHYAASKRRGAVDDDVHRGGAGSPGKGEPGLAGLGAHPDGRGIAAGASARP